jgi:transposase
LLQFNLKTVRAYLMANDFHYLWTYHSVTWAAKFLDGWCSMVMRSRIDPMKRIARQLRSHRELILNYFRAKKALNSGVVEAMNNNAKFTIRKGRGFRNFTTLKIALFHEHGNLPTPQMTHRFW